MLIQDLKKLLSETTPSNPFTLDAATLGGKDMTALFDNYLPSTGLKVTQPTATVNDLKVAGKMDLGDITGATVLVTFFPDTEQQNVGGIQIDLSLSDWTFNAPFADFSGAILQSFGFKSPELLLRAGTTGASETAAEALLGGTISVTGKEGTKAVTLLAQIPFDTPSMKAGFAPNYVFDVTLDQVTLSDLSALTQFISGGNFDIIPSDIPVADEFDLTFLEFVIDPEENQLLSFRAEVTSAKGLTIIPSAFEITSFTFSFMVLMPGSSSEVTGVAATALSIYGTEVDVSLSIPDLFLQGNLSQDTLVPLKPFVANFIPADFIPDDFQLSELVVGIGLKAPNNYVFDIVLSNLWQAKIGKQTLEMTMLGVYMSGQKGVSADLSVQGQITFAGAILYLSAVHPEGGNSWQFSGGTVDATAIQLPGFSGDGGLQIGNLLSDLTQSFGIDVPTPVKSLELKNILISFDTGTDAFTFHCTGEMTIEDTPVIMTVSMDITAVIGQQQKQNGYNAQFGGTLQVGTREFDLKFDHENLQSDTFIATYSHKDGDPDSISLQELVKDIAPSIADAIPTGIEIELDDIKFVFLKKQTAKQFAFGLDIGLSVNLSDIPLVGNKLPKNETLEIKNLDILFSSALFTQDDISAINAILPNTVIAFPIEGLSKGVNLTADLELGSISKHLALGVPKSSTSPPDRQVAGSESGKVLKTANPSIADTSSEGASSSTKWVNIQKQLGIFQFKRIGLGYQNNVLYFALDAGIDLGPLSMSMDGLSIGSPLTKFQPTFNIQGLGLSYNKPPLEIEGSLLKTPSDQLSADTEFQFDGLAVVKAEDFSLSAIGSYAQLTSGDPSLFVFAQLEAPLGGPPAFFITGLMAGFGFNRNLAIPAQNEVQNFPLLLLAQPPQPGQNAKSQDPMFVLDVLEGRKPITPGGSTKEWIKPSPGDYWLGVGLEFTSFEIVNSKALLIVEFGHDLVFALLGLSTMQLPQPTESSETYVFVELQLEAVFKPLDGFFGLSAVLSNNSFVLTPDCHLTGGFAFYIWYGPNEHAGQFVLTLGGYHPAFQPPTYFPTEPRLGFNWAVSSLVSIDGGAYFALTPSCVMAGASLQVLFHDGGLRAWFIAYLDVLISWRPFFYTADIGISIGISLRLNLLFCHATIKLSLGAKVNMWGPPTGGIVKIHVVVVTFTVHFGSDNAGTNNRPLGWGDFKNLLPHSNNVCRININSGLYKTQDSQESSSGKRWVIRAQNFSFSTLSAIPASQLRYGDASAKAAANGINGNIDGALINIRPMDKSGVTGTHRLKITKGGQIIEVSGWSLEANHSNIPASLWEKPPEDFKQIPDKPSADVVPNQMVGYQVTAPLPVLGSSLGLVLIKTLMEEYLPFSGRAPLDANVTPSSNFLPQFNDKSVGDIAQIMTEGPKSSRNAIFESLQQANLYSGQNESLDELATQATHIYSDAPMIQS